MKMDWKNKKEQEEELTKKIFGWGVAIVAILIITISSFYTVPAGHRGVLTTFGKVDTLEKQEGFGVKIPFAQKVTDVEVRTQRLDVDADSSSKDLQDVQTKVAVNYHVEPSRAADLYQNIGLDYRGRIIIPAVEETVKSVTARYTAEELITKRSNVKLELRDQLKERLSSSAVILDDFNIVNFQFSEEFDKAIEAKVTAEQLKLKAERDLDRIKIEKEQKITQAEAEAQSIIIQSEALKANEDILELRFIEKWDGVMPLVYSQEGSSNNLIGLDLVNLANGDQE